ncbi:MAG: aldolase [Clostridia bacterium]|nr:aldolase [Clostridia bacterium]
MNPLKEKIKAGKPICGTHVTLCEPAICEIYGQMGYDYIWLDMEHSALSYKDVMYSLNAANLRGTPVVVRVPQDDLTATKKVLEMGPDGIIFPMVNTPEEANRLIDYTLYPPIGKRGCGPMRAVHYNGITLEDYTQKQSLEMCRFIQMESTVAIENLEEMAKNPYIDGFVFGPVDLSGSIGKLLQVLDEDDVEKETETQKWMKKAISILKAHGKYVGISFGDTRPEVIRHWHDMGIDMISVGSDFGYLYEQGMKALDTLRREHIGVK